LHPLWLEPGLVHLTWRDTGPDIDVCRGRGHTSFAMNITVPSRDWDLVILRLRGWRLNLARGHLRRKPLLIGLRAHPWLRLSLWRGY